MHGFQRKNHSRPPSRKFAKPSPLWHSVWCSEKRRQALLGSNLLRNIRVSRRSGGGVVAGLSDRTVCSSVIPRAALKDPAMNSLRGTRPGFLQRFLLPRSQHEGFEIPKKTTTASFQNLLPGSLVRSTQKAPNKMRKRCSDAGSRERN